MKEENIESGNTANGKVQFRSISLRDQIIRILNPIGVPVFHGLIYKLGAALYQCKIPPPGLATLLSGGEARPFSANREKYPIHICPALTASRFLPLAQLVTVSTWPLENRIVGMRSLRVNHLKTILSLLDLIEDSSASGNHDGSKALTALLRLHTESVPNAVPRGTAANLNVIRRATEEELALIGPDDMRERFEAAEKLSKLPEINRLRGTARLQNNLVGCRR